MNKRKSVFSVLLLLVLVICLPMTVHAAKLSKTSSTMTVGKTQVLSLKNATATVKWSSSNKTVATVNKNGKVTAKKSGKTVITAKSGGKSYTCKVTVKGKGNLATLRKGDFSAFAGTYVATKECNSGYGGGKNLVNLVLKKNGRITGGQPTYMGGNIFPTSKPKSITKDSDGAFVCKLSSNCTMRIYPKGAIENNDYVRQKQSYLKNTVYIRVTLIDGGAMDVIYYKK